MDLVRARQAFYPLTELCPAPLILNFWCLQLVIAELILCDKAVPAANEFLFLPGDSSPLVVFSRGGQSADALKLSGPF